MMWLSPNLVEHFGCFEVMNDRLFPTHRPIRLRLRLAKPTYKVMQLQRPAEFNMELVDMGHFRRYREEPSPFFLPHIWDARRSGDMQKVYVLWSGWMEAAIVKAEEERTGARVPAKYQGRGTLPFQLADQFRPAPKQPRHGEED